MIKEALQYIVGLGQKQVIDVNGEKYSTGELNYIPEPKVAPIKLHTLSGVVDYIRSKIDNPKTFNAVSPWLIIIESPTSLSVATKADPSSYNRNIYIKCEALTPLIQLNRFMDAESFNIMLQSMFVDTGDRAKVLSVIGNIKEEVVQNSSDDGISQKVVAKRGVSLAENVVVPNPVLLAPYRTFSEIEQPASQFVLRLKNGPECALFEAEGGAWRPESMQNIKNYFEDNLKELIESGEVFIIS